MIEINNTTKNKIPSKKIIKTVSRFLLEYKKQNKDVSLAFVGDKKIKNLNRDYRKKNSTTDILSFAGEGGFLGELIININQIKKQAKDFGVSLEKELIFILVHGLLHLVGRTHDTDKKYKKMMAEAEVFIKKL